MAVRGADVLGAEGEEPPPSSFASAAPAQSSSAAPAAARRRNPPPVTFRNRSTSTLRPPNVTFRPCPCFAAPGPYFAAKEKERSLDSLSPTVTFCTAGAASFSCHTVIS